MLIKQMEISRIYINPSYCCVDRILSTHLIKKIKNKSSFKINSIFRLIKLPSKIGYFQHAPCKTYYRERSYHPKPTIKPEPPLGT